MSTNDSMISLQKKKLQSSQIDAGNSSFYYNTQAVYTDYTNNTTHGGYASIIAHCHSCIFLKKGLLGGIIELDDAGNIRIMGVCG